MKRKKKIKMQASWLQAGDTTMYFKSHTEQLSVRLDDASASINWSPDSPVLFLHTHQGSVTH